MSKLLLIDDEETIVKVLAMSLKVDGHEVVTALNGEDGVAAFEKEAPDIVITDIKMPGMDGIEVLERVKSIEPDAEVIIITGHGDIDHAVEALKLGASDFINKPVRDEVLSVALHRAEKKIQINRRLKAHTHELEEKVEAATREIRRKSAFMSKLIKSSNDGIIATDGDFRVVIFNPGAERIFGFAAADVRMKVNVVDLYPQEVMAELVHDERRRTSSGALPWRETLIRARDGEQIPVRFSGTLLHEQGEIMGSVAFFQDLREIKRLEAELVRSERLAAIGQTVAGLAHGVKNLVQGFKGGSYLVNLGIKKNSPEKLNQGWNMVQQNINRTSDLVMDLLTLSKERAPEYEECAPNEIAGDVCELVAETARENGIELVLDCDPRIGAAVMDPRTIHSCLLNLMSNAVDACLFDENSGKKYRVCLKSVLENDNCIRFEVRDNGAGMTEEVRKKIFSSFFSTKGHRGTGLGLLVTRKHIEEHGGAVAVDSEAGAGTAFTVRLPVRRPEEAD